MARIWRPNHTDPPAADRPPPSGGNRRRVWPWVLLGAVLVVVLVVIAVACTTLLGAVVAPSVDRASAWATIRYQLTGDGTASLISWTQAGGEDQQSGDTELPWSKTVEFSDSFRAAVSLAAHRGAGNGDLTCTIVNQATGQVIVESTSSGPHAAVSCYGPANPPPDR